MTGVPNLIETDNYCFIANKKNGLTFDFSEKNSQNTNNTIGFVITVAPLKILNLSKFESQKKWVWKLESLINHSDLLE